MRRTFIIAAAVFALIILLFHQVYRPWQLNWGARDEEIARVMPGDEIVSEPTFDATRAVTIERDAAAIWPWLVQIGYRRAGFYSYDRLDNDGIPSTERILPEHQGLAVGDLIPLSQSSAAEVRLLEPGRYMLLVVDDSDDHDPWTWAWGLYPEGTGRTRLVTRLRVRLNPVSTVLLDAFEIIMMRKCLLGIKRRAETSPAGMQTP